MDRGHPTLAELTLDLATARKGSVQAGDRVGGSHAEKMLVLPSIGEEVQTVPRTASVPTAVHQHNQR